MQCAMFVGGWETRKNHVTSHRCLYICCRRSIGSSRNTADLLVELQTAWQQNFYEYQHTSVTEPQWSWMIVEYRTDTHPISRLTRGRSDHWTHMLAISALNYDLHSDPVSSVPRISVKIIKTSDLFVLFVRRSNKFTNISRIIVIAMITFGAMSRVTQRVVMLVDIKSEPIRHRWEI